VNALIKPHIPPGSEPSRDDDPTGVRALLSSLPEPDPMPPHLVDRINASLAAEQAQRAAKASGTPATPMLARVRRRPRRLLYAIAGAAAAAFLVAVVGNNMFTMHPTTTTSGSAAVASASNSNETAGGRQPRAAGKTPALAGRATAPSLVQIVQSGNRYTKADFVSQAQALRLAVFRPQAAVSPGVGPAGTTPGLADCLDAIGAAGAQVIRADVAFYEGQPAVVVVATANGFAIAYVVGRQCSRTDAAVLRSATPLPR
jgi:hypothetical protein